MSNDSKQSTSRSLIAAQALTVMPALFVVLGVVGAIFGVGYAFDSDKQRAEYGLKAETASDLGYGINIDGSVGKDDPFLTLAPQGTEGGVRLPKFKELEAAVIAYQSLASHYDSLAEQTQNYEILWLTLTGASILLFLRGLSIWIDQARVIRKKKDRARRPAKSRKLRGAQLVYTVNREPQPRRWFR